MNIIITLLLSLVTNSFEPPHQFECGEYLITLENECGVEIGSISINDITDDYFLVDLFVVSTQTGQTGEINGKAIIQDKENAILEKVYDDGQSRIITKIFFQSTLDGVSITVDSHKSYLYHSAGICFDGQYVMQF